jgi:hypothetical protein
MKKPIATMMLLAGGLFAAPAVRVGIGIGVPAAVAVVRPACPGPGYTWVDGYYAPNGIVGWRLLGSSGCRDRRASLRRRGIARTGLVAFTCVIPAWATTLHEISHRQPWVKEEP